MNRLIENRDLDIEFNKKLEFLITRGMYYKEAYKWYNIQCFGLFYQFIVVLFLLVIVLLVCVNTLIGLNGLYPIRETLPFSIYTNYDSETFYPNLIRLQNETGSGPSDLLYEFMLGNYIRDYEGYNGYG